MSGAVHPAEGRDAYYGRRRQRRKRTKSVSTRSEAMVWVVVVQDRLLEEPQELQYSTVVVRYEYNFKSTVRYGTVPTGYCSYEYYSVSWSLVSYWVDMWLQDISLSLASATPDFPCG